MKIRDALETRLIEARAQLENPATTEKQTEIARGRILELKKILAFGKDEPEMPPNVEI
jgi:hypothetical protein